MSNNFTSRVDSSLLNWPIEFLHDIKIVGVINTSPDSYFKESIASSIDAAVAMARRHIQEGAHLVEIGGLSGGSAARRITSSEEIERTLPFVKAIAEEFPQVTVIIDTFRSEVARPALEAGATWINDVTAMTFDPEMPALAREFNCHCVLMHLEGPGGHKGRKLNRPFFSDVVSEIHNFFEQRLNELERSGLRREQIIIDVGLGAGKRPAHDYELLARLSEFNDLGCEQMSACSRKQFVEAISAVPPTERLGGSIVGSLWSVLQGCRYIRVHEVRPYAQALDVWNGIMSRVNGLRQTSTSLAHKGSNIAGA